MDASPQRFLANNRNLLRTAMLAPDSVLPVTNKVLPLKTPIAGTAQATLSGTYTGDEEATYDFQIVDTDVDLSRISKPTFSGAGSGTIPVESISATGDAQVYTLELSNAGIPETEATVTVEGAVIQSRASGAAGNADRIAVDQSGLIFTPSTYSTLTDLSAGTGGATPFIGAAFDWDSKALTADGLIPADAHRIAFGADKSAVYLAYKEFKDGAWQYHTVPALLRDVPKGTIIQFVTGGRTVVVSRGASSETYPNIATAYDLLYALRTTSQLVIVSSPTGGQGIVVNDRTPSGQASRELSLRTDAHAEATSGSGSSYATGFENVSVAADAGTQRVTATCFAVTGTDSPNARLGPELWQLKSSLLGNLGIVQTGVPFNTAQFGATIPVRLPPGFGADKGAIGATIIYASRTGGGDGPPICIASPVLGPDASDKIVRFRYSPAPSGDCNCEGMPVPNLFTSCLGTPGEGGGSVAYKDDTNVRLTELRAFVRAKTKEWTYFGSPDAPAPVGGRTIAIGGGVVEAEVIATPVPSTIGAEATLSLLAMADQFESTIAQIDALTPSSPPAYREAGMAAWDDAFTAFQDDIASEIGGASPPDVFLRNMPSRRYTTALQWALASAGIANLGKADASTVAGDGCWRDWGGSRWIDVDGIYAPFFSNHAYWSVRRGANGAYYSSHEFAFMPNIKCPEDLVFGDEVDINIKNAGWGATYQQGDELTLPIIAAAALALSGGHDGAPLQTWNPTGSVFGPMAPYVFNPDAPVAYSGGDSGTSLTFLIVPGGIPFAKGDRFRFAVEGGHFKWRKDGGAWQNESPPLSIPLTSVSIDSGLSLSFTAGAAASFVPGDTFSFRATQPWAVSNLKTPNAALWKWSGSGAVLEATFAEVTALGMIALLHTLPVGATVTIDGGVDSSGYIWSEDLAWRPNCIWQVLSHSALFVRITIANATNGAVQWGWIGDPLKTALSSDFQAVRSYDVRRPTSGLQGGLFKGKALSGEISWQAGSLNEADVGWSYDDAEAIVSMIDWLKEHNDEPMIYVPQVTRTADPVLFATISSDAIAFPDPHAFNRANGIERQLAVTLPLEGVWR